MKKKYVAPASEYIRFDVEDVLTKRLPLKDYGTDDGGISGGTGVESDPEAVNPFG